MTSEMQAAVEWVQGIYRESGMNMTGFARLCGVSVDSAISWIRAIKCPYKESLVKVGEAFGITPPPHVLLSAEKYAAEASERSRQAANKARAAKKLKKQKEPFLVYHWEHDGKAREFCRKKHCEWRNHNGICNMPVCMKEVSHADARKSEKD